MTPPPLPGSPSVPRGRSIAHQAAIGCLVAPLLAVLINAVSTASALPQAAKLLTGSFCLLLIAVGFVLAIVALAGIQRHGRPGLLGRSLAGLVINGVLLAIFVSGVITGFGNARKSRRMAEDVSVAAQDLRASVEKSFDPTSGFTNVDLSQYERLQRGLREAAEQLSGDDAIIARALAANADRMQAALKQYQQAVAELQEAQVLSKLDFLEKDEFSSRRAVVERFLSANASLNQVAANAEDKLRADLASGGLAAPRTARFMSAYHAQNGPMTAIVLQIRQCDVRLGQAMLGALDLLQSERGNWEYRPAVDEIQFRDDATAEAYGGFLEDLETAAQEQLKLQQKLLKAWPS